MAIGRGLEEPPDCSLLARDFSFKPRDFTAWGLEADPRHSDSGKWQSRDELGLTHGLM